MMDVDELKRLALQKTLDAKKTALERNRLGQFATPTNLADDILGYANRFFPDRQKIRFLDPAFGTGAFYSSLLRTFPRTQIDRATAYEIDPLYGQAVARLWANEDLNLTIADFTLLESPTSEDEKANLVICNPPYVRHHHIGTQDKQRMQFKIFERTGIHLSGLAGLYNYFLCLADSWMAEDAIAGWLIPSEFMDVNYGEQVKNYLLDNVTLLHIHRFDPSNTQFDDALVSSAIIWFRKAAPPKNHSVNFSYGGSLTSPHHSSLVPASTLRRHGKWTHFPLLYREPSEAYSLKVSDVFNVKRGIATGSNAYFVLRATVANYYEIPPEFLQPVLPSPRSLKSDEIEADELGNPIVDQRLFLVSCDLPEAEIRQRSRELWAYFERGIKLGIDQTYICSHRTPWYAQEKRPATPFVCTYMGRQSASRSAFRFILNHSRATALNVYLLLYPKPEFRERIEGDATYRRAIWNALKHIPESSLTAEGRVYGGGLHKMEPRELSNAPLILPEL